MTRPVAVVTGAARGLGRAAAHRLAEAGFDIVIVDLIDGADETAALVASAGGASSYVRGDISDTARTEELTDQCWDAFGRVDSLVNNAGVAVRPLVDPLDLDEAGFDRQMDINLRGTFFLTQAVAKRMRAHPAMDGAMRSIVFITSIAAEMVSPERAAYNLSKSALAMLASVFADRLGGSGIAVYDVRPGYMLTEMTASGAPADIEAVIASGGVPLQRWGTPDDVGNVVATLARGALPYTTGQTIWVDGGLHIHRPPTNVRFDHGGL